VWVSGRLRVLIEEAPKGKRWVAIAADWPGLERNGPSEAAAIEKLLTYVPRYLKVARRARLGAELERQDEHEVVGRHTGTGSTDFWGISFAPSDEDREAMDPATFERNASLLRAAWAEFDEVARGVSAELRKGPRGGGRSRDEIVGHVLRVESGDFARRVGVPEPAEWQELLPAKGRTAHRDQFIEAMRAWPAEEKPLGKWTLPYLLRHAAYHVLDHAWEMEDRDLTEPASAHG
jgi:hypothetical protein